MGRNVIALGAVSFLTDLSTEMIYPLLPVFLATTLGASAGTLGLIEGMAESVAGLLKFFSGWFSDRRENRKPLVVAGYTIASLARPLVGLAQSATHVLMIRLTDRVGKGIRTSPRDALIADSVPDKVRGLAYGFHRAADHGGAVVGPLVGFALLTYVGLEMRTVFLLAAIPGALSVLVLLVFVRDVPRSQPLDKGTSPLGSIRGLGPRFWRLMAVMFLFTLGASTDAFLLLRASDLGVPIAQLPIIWAMLHVVKSASSAPGGALSDKRGRRPVIIAGWVIYALVYLGFSFANSAWHVWALFAVYGLHFGLVEGTEKALVADMVAPNRRGSAFGAFNLTLSAAALPASVIFGVIWDKFGAATAFQYGAIVATLATIGLTVVLATTRAGKSSE